MNIEHTNQISAKRRPNVCLIDDDEIMLSLFSRIIQRSGCDLEIAQGPKEAISVLSSATFDLIICDLRMPDMNDGEELLSVIHKLFPQLSIVMMSCDVPSEIHDRLIAAGASGCITKPITVATVSTLIDSLGNPELSRSSDAA